MQCRYLYRNNIGYNGDSLNSFKRCVIYCKGSTVTIKAYVSVIELYCRLLITELLRKIPFFIFLSSNLDLVYNEEL